MIAPDLLVRAGQIIRNGGLVAFPTETVYGLGADALNPRAIDRIYQVKRRPATSPLIVHVGSMRMAKSLVSEWPDAAEDLCRIFWPGPLTLVLPKQATVPDNVTAGLPTVAVRQPDHRIAAALIREAGTPIAAPSANRFTGLSPTTAEHVLKALGDEVDLILDDGPTRVGIESTVLSLAGIKPVLLRPGAITVSQLEDVVGEIEIAETAPEGAHASPGMHAKHYSPLTPLFLVPSGTPLPQRGRGAFLWLNESLPAAHTEQMPADSAEYAAILYDKLHHLDDRGFDWIAVEQPPEWPEWAGVLDRLRRASN